MIEGYHWDGLHLLDQVRAMSPLDKLHIFLHVVIEKDIMLKHTSEHWKHLVLPNFSEVSDEWLCHYGVRFDLIKTNKTNK